MPPWHKGIDALPDEVLQHILGFLEAQESVRTCVLSRRWRNLWKSAPSLRILAKGKFLGSVEKQCNFLDSLLVLRGGAPLDTFELRFSYLTTASSIVQVEQRLGPLVENWFCNASVCKAQVLSLYVDKSGSIYGLTGTLPLYKLLPLNSQHLTRLELGNLVVNSSFLNFSNCPSLEHLKFENCFFRSYPYGFKPGDYRIRICAPNLVLLHLDDSYGWKIPVLESMPSLVKAFVKIGMATRDSCARNCTCEFCDNSYSIGDGTGSNACVLLNGLSEAKDLTLISAPRTFIFKKDLRWCPTFSKLKTLLLNDYWCVPNDFRALVCLLEHSPVLQKLTLSLSSKVEQQRERNNVSLNPMERSAAISQHLKIIEVKCDVVDERICKLTLFLCAFHINLSFSNPDQDEEEGQV